MNELEASLRDSVAVLMGLKRDFALVGGLAVSVRAEPRLTRDADLAVAVVSDAEAEALILEFCSSGYEVVAVVEQEATGRLATARLTDSSRDLRTVTDLLFASCGIEPEIVAAAEVLSILPGFSLPVATLGHLIAMKLLARDDRRRPADADDLASLASLASPEDWSAAEAAVELIVDRGYSRGRDLPDALRGLREHGAF